MLPGDIKRFKSVVDNWEWGTGGLHNINSRTKLYTNRGLATHPPLRFVNYCVVFTITDYFVTQKLHSLKCNQCIRK